MKTFFSPTPFQFSLPIAVSLRSLFLVQLLFFLFASCEQNRLTEATPFQLIPHDAMAVIQVNDYIELTPAFEKNSILKYWKEAHPEMTEVLSKLTPKEARSGDLYVFSPEGKDLFATTYIGKKRKNDTLSKNLPPLKKYEGIDIHQLQTGVFEAHLGTLSLRSSTLLAIENSIRKFKQNRSHPVDATLRKLQTSLNTGSPLNLMLRPQSNSMIESIFPSTPFLKDKIGGWMALDMELEEPLEWDGIDLVNDSLPNPINWIQSLERKESLLPKVAPANMDAFFTVSISNMAQLEANFKQFSQLKNLPLQQVDFRELALVDELGWLRYKEDTALLMHLNSLENEFPLTEEQNNPKTYRGVQYFEVRLPKTVETFSHAFAQTKTMNWGALLEEFVLFAENETILKHIISNYRDGRVLAKQTAYKDLEDGFSSRNSFQWVAASASLFDSNKFPVEAYPLVALQGVGESNFTHLHFRFGKASSVATQGRVVTTANFTVDHPIALGPQWLKNHRNKGMVVAVQDQENILYLFSSQGNLYWKKDLEEAIIGPIQQVDLYKNKKWQLAFRTQKYLYILDRNGKEVKPFKIKLPTSNQALPLAVFDYDKNRNYRFVLAQDKRLLMYDNKGKRVRGFTRTQLKAPLMHPPKHFRIKKKDYLILQRINGTLGILNRLGKDRIKVTGNLDFSGSPFFRYLDTFTTTDMTGNLVQVDVRGNVIKSPYELKPGHAIDATAKSLVSLSENILAIKGIPITLPFGNYTDPKIFYLDNVLYITTTDIEAQKVYLYYSNGTAVPDFPVYGIGAADVSLNNKKKPQLVVKAENNNLLIYQINR